MKRTLFLIAALIPVLAYSQNSDMQRVDRLLEEHHLERERALKAYLGEERSSSQEISRQEQKSSPASAKSEQSRRLEVMFFFRNNCGSCLKVKNEILPGIMEKYGDRIDLRKRDVADSANLQALISLHSRYSDTDAVVPAFFVAGSYLSGRKAITQHLDKVIERALTSRLPVGPAFSRVDLVTLFKKLSWTMIASAGLVDGVNPCAFAVIVFFVSFLAVYGYSRREIVYIGSAYCAAVFVTYLLIGLGLFRSLYALEHTYLAIRLFYGLVAVFCFALAVFSFLDYLRFKKTGKSDSVTLQLPKFLKKRINLTIGSRLRGKKERNPWELMLAAFSIGFLVSLLEAVCTGQVYIPVIVSILRYPELRAKAFLYLLLYNVMFIVPLLLVFLLSFLGCSSASFTAFLKKHLGRLKLLMALLFFSLGTFVVGYEYFYSLLSRVIGKFF